MTDVGEKPHAPEEMSQEGSNLSSQVKNTIVENGIGEKSEFIVPTPEQAEALLENMWNITHSPKLEPFFVKGGDFPVTPENYSSYADTFVKYFGAMRQILDGKKLNEIDMEKINKEPKTQEETPTLNYPFQHEVQYKANKSSLSDLKNPPKG